MLNPRQSRELAVQVLFLWDANGSADVELSDRIGLESEASGETRQQANKFAFAAWEIRQQTDDWLTRVAPQWPPRRQPGVDRAILRLAVWELNSGITPPKVVIDEAIELAKVFSTENSPAFVNGVLDAILKERTQLKENP